MEECWVHDRIKRIDIFSVVKFLRDVKQQAIENGEFVPIRLTAPARIP